jgi:shikimate kinase
LEHHFAELAARTLSLYTSKMTNSIMLIGMPWTGKNSIGEQLAAKLGYAFISMDQYMRDREQMSTIDIVTQKGDAHIHQLELDCITTAPLKDCVVASSGEFPLTEYLGTREVLQQNGAVVVWLYRDFDDLLQRKQADSQGDRSVTGMREDSSNGFRQVFDAREPFYRRWADITVACTGLETEKIVSQVIEELQKRS